MHGFIFRSVPGLENLMSDALSDFRLVFIENSEQLLYDPFRMRKQVRYCVRSV